MEQPSTPLSSLLQTLKAQANVALDDDLRVQREVENARRVLLRTAEAASGALERLSHAEEQLEQKWAQLATLLTEVKSLELERHEAMMLAQQLASIEVDPPEREVSDDELFHDVDLAAEPSVLVAMDSQARQSPVADLRAALKHVVQTLPPSRLTR